MYSIWLHNSDEILHYIILFYSHFYSRFSNYINLVNFLSCLKVKLYIIWSTFGGFFFFFGEKSKLYKPVFYEYEQCMYICFSCFAYFDLPLSTNFECRLWYMYCYWDSWVMEYQNYIYLSVCKWKAFNSRSYFCI